MKNIVFSITSLRFKFNAYPLCLVACLFLCFSLNSFGALYDRGNGLIYDDVLNITWLQDANYAFTSGYSIVNAVGEIEENQVNIQADGRMGWEAAITWVSQLSYAGYNDWRLPSANLMNSSNPCDANDGSCDFGYNNTTAEVGHMFYKNLNNAAFTPILTNISFTDSTSGLIKSFINVKSDKYWYQDELESNSTEDAWSFDASDGDNSDDSKVDSSYAWAVHDGDIGASPVPVPAAAWLFGSALAGLGVLRKKK